MGNEPLCANDTRDIKNTVLCGRQPEFKNSTAITIVNRVPVINGPPLNFQKQSTFKKVEKSAIEFCRDNQLHPSYAPMVARIIAYGHNNLFQAYRKLPETHKQQFLEEIKFIDIDFMDSLYHNLLLNQRKRPEGQIQPPAIVVEEEDISSSSRKQYIQMGRDLIARRQIGVMILCAGSSSRFLFQDKFLYPLELKSHKTTLELLMDRIKRNANCKENETCDIPLVFACNSQNRYTIENFLKNRKYLGFDVSKVRFIQIPNHPILNPKGKLCLSFEYKILSRPAGTAKCVEEMLSSSIYEFLKGERVTYMHIVGTENIAQNPMDPQFLGYLAGNKLEMVGKCTDAAYPTENFNRYGSYGDKKNYLLTVDEVLTQLPQNKLDDLIEEFPIAMNSIVCSLPQLRTMVRQYKNSMFLSKEYRALEKSQTFYNFQKDKPEMKEKVFVFEKDIGHLFTCSRNYHLLKVNNSEFIPILTKNAEYSLKEACKKLTLLHEKEISFIRRADDQSTR